MWSNSRVVEHLSRSGAIWLAALLAVVASPALAAVSLSEAPAGRAASVSGVAPVLTQPSDMVVAAGGTADKEIHASDADGNPLTFLKSSGPGFMTVSTTDPGSGIAIGNIHLAPGLAQAGATVATVTAFDGALSDSRSFGINVQPTPVAPVLTQPADMTVNAGETTIQTLDASDANGDPLGFYLVSGPAYVTVSTTDPGAGSALGEIVVAPGFPVSGVAEATIEVSDGSLTDQRSLMITVNHMNAAPLLTQPADMALRAGETKEQQLTASDPNGDPLAFSMVSGPAYMTVTTVDAVAGIGKVRLSPGSSDVGAQTVMVVVTDGALSDQKSFVVSARADVAPILDQPSPMVVLAGLTAYQVLGAYDADGDSLEFSKVAGPAYMTVTTAYNTLYSVGVLQLAPTAGDVGLASGTIRVSDGLLSDDKVVSIETVSELSNSPFPVNDTGTYEIGIQGANGRAPGAECPPPLGVTGGIISREWVGDDSGDFNVYSVLSFDTKPWTRGSSFSLHVQEQQRIGTPFGQLGAGVIIEYLRSNNPIPHRFVNTTEVEGTFSLFRLASEVDLFATGGIDLTALINGILQSPGPRYLYLRFRFPVCTDGDHLNDQIEFYSGGRAGESQATRIVESRATIVTVDLDPNVINLKSHALWVTAYIEPTGFDPAIMDISSLRLAGSVPAAGPKVPVVGDHDGNGIPELMVKFSRELLDSLLTPGTNLLVVSGALVSGERFEGADSVRVLNPGSHPLSVSVAPNPLNPVGVLTFVVAQSGPVSINLFNIQGRLVRRLLETQAFTEGSHEVLIDGRGEAGQPLASGVYFYRVESLGGNATGRFAVLK